MRHRLRKRDRVKAGGGSNNNAIRVRGTPKRKWQERDRRRGLKPAA